MIRLGMIGCGGMGSMHTRELHPLEQIDITVCCDLLADRAKDAAEFCQAQWCTDYREVFDKVDAVWICTEPFNRVEIVTAAAATGKHIFTEKPLALTLEDGDRMIAAAREAGVVYMLGYCLRYWQPYKLMRDMYVDGQLGELINCWTRRYMPADMRNLWYGDQELSGGVALDFGSHDVDWLMWIGGKVRSLFAQTARIRDGARADEHSQCMLIFENGGMAASDVTWMEAISESSLGVLGTRGSLLVGRDGVLKKKLVGEDEVTIDVASALAVDPTGKVGQRSEDGEIQAVEQMGESMYEHFVRCIQDGVTPETDAAVGRDVLQTVLAIRESAETGNAVTLSG